MAQRRMLAKSISTSKKLNRVSDQAALLFSWTIPHCDDYGNMDGSIGQLKAIVVPSRGWSLVKVEKSRNELVGIGAWIIYEVDQETYIHVEKFEDFQTFKGDRDRLSLYPKYKTELRKPLDSTWKPVDSSKLSEVKVSESKLSESNPAPKTAGYMTKFGKPSKIFTSKQLLADMICRETSGEMKMGKLMGIIKSKGEEQVRRSWAEVKADGAKNPIALLMWKLGRIKIIAK